MLLKEDKEAYLASYFDRNHLTSIFNISLRTLDPAYVANGKTEKLFKDIQPE